jgi:predicted lactoylglutathione lyase
MNRTIMISLPVADLALSRAFYTAIGFAENPDFQHEGSAHMVCSETISVMLLTHEKWKALTARPIAPEGSSEVGLSVSCESRAEVDAMNAAAARFGGIADVNPVDDFPFMYGRDFTDPDGHVWGAKWFDKAALRSRIW